MSFFFIINSGSSSLKFKLLDVNKLSAVYSGHIDGIGLKSCLYIEEFGKKRHQTAIQCQNHHHALEIGLKKLIESRIIKDLKEIRAVGHRVVHGGETFWRPTIINPKVIREIKKLSSLAPLHNPPNLEGISAAQKIFPKIPHIAVFDTSFHHTIPGTAHLYAIPYHWYQKYGVRKYGFHGTSHQYVAKEATNYLKKKGQPYKRLIICHLGNGASISAVKNGVCLDTSMGFTPLEGIPMGTRSGDIDPAIIFFLQKEKKMNLIKIEKILIRQSGLQGLSEISSDVRVLRDAWFKKKNAHAKRALDVFCYRIAKYISSYLVPLEGLDALIFTAGIGEHAWYIRKWIVDQLAFIGAKLDSRKNLRNDFEINNKKSRVSILVIPTNEEKQIATEIRKTLMAEGE